MAKYCSVANVEPWGAPHSQSQKNQNAHLMNPVNHGNGATIVKGTILAAAATVTQALRPFVDPETFEMINSGCGLLVGWSINRLTDQHGRIEAGRETSLEDLELNGHLSRLAATATRYVIKAELRDKVLGLDHDKKVLNVLLNRAEETWLTFPDAAELEGKTFTDLITFQTTGQEPLEKKKAHTGRDSSVSETEDHQTMVGFTTAFWEPFIRYALTGQSGAEASDDFVRAFAKILTKRFPKQFLETAKDAADKNPVGFASVLLHFFGALRRSQAETDQRIDKLIDLVQESIYTKTGNIKPRHVTRFTKAASELQKEIIELKPLLEGLPDNVRLDSERVISRLEGALNKGHGGIIAVLDRRFKTILSGLVTLMLVLLVSSFWQVQAVKKTDTLKLTIQAFQTREAEIKDLPSHEQAVAIRENRLQLADKLGINLNEVPSVLSTRVTDLLEEAETLRRRYRDAPIDQQAWPSVFSLLMDAGDLANSSKDFGRATEAYLKAYEVAEAQNAADGLGAVLLRLAEVAANQGDDSLSLEHLERSLQIAEACGDRALKVEALKMLLYRLHDMGKFQEGKERSAELLEAIKEPEGLGPLPSHALYAVGDLLKTMGDYAGAAEVYEKAVASHQETCANPECTWLTDFQLALSSAHYGLGEYQAAIEHLDRAEALMGNDPYDRVHAFLRRSTILVSLNSSGTDSDSVKRERAAEAVSKVESAIEICQEELSDEPALLSNALEVMAGIHSEHGKLTESIALLEQARSVEVAHGGEYSRRAASLNLLIAEEANAAGLMEKASRHFHLAAKAALTLDSSDPLRSRCLLAQVFHLMAHSQVAAFREFIGPLEASLDQTVQPDPTGRWALALCRGILGAIDFDEALTFRQLNEAVKLAEATPDLGPQARILTEAFQGLASVSIGGNPEGVKQIQNAIREAKEIPDPPKLFLSTLENLEANALILADRGDETIPYLEKQLSIVRGSVEPKPMTLAEALGSLAGAYQSAGRTDEGQSLYEEMSQILADATEPWSLGVTTQARNYAQFLILSGQSKDASDLLAATENQLQQMVGSQSPSLASVLSLRGSASHNAGDQDSAIAKSEAAVQIMRRAQGIPPQHFLEVLAVHSIILGYGKAPDEAVKYFLESARSLALSELPTNASVALNLWRVADTLTVVDQDSLAWPVVDKAWEIDRQLDPKGVSVARDQNLRSVLFCNEEKFELAEEAAKDGLLILTALSKVSPPEDWHRVLLDLLSNYSTVLAKTNATTGDLEFFRQLSASLALENPPVDSSAARNLWGMADSLIVLGREGDAWPLINKAWEIDLQVDPKGLSVARDQNLRSLLFSREGKLKEAEETAREGLMIVAKHAETDTIREQIFTDLARNYRNYLGAGGIVSEQIDARIEEILLGKDPLSAADPDEGTNAHPPSQSDPR